MSRTNANGTKNQQGKWCKKEKTQQAVWCCVSFIASFLQSKVEEMAGEIIATLSAEDVGVVLTKDDLFVDVSESQHLHVHCPSSNISPFSRVSLPCQSPPPPHTHTHINVDAVLSVLVYSVPISSIKGCPRVVAALL